MLTFGKTGFGTGRCYSCINYHYVTESVDYFLSNKGSVTNLTLNTCSKTGVLTIGSNCIKS